MKTIIINSKKYGQHKVFIDDCDYDYLNLFTWCIHKDKKRKEFYAWANTWNNGKRGIIKMHRLILAVTNPKIQVDHRDHNGLNNQRQNLRIATHSQNSANKPALKNKSSKYKGVCWDKSRNKWTATMQHNHKFENLGRFDNEIEAALAYNNAAKKYHGDFAYLNEIK